VRYVNRRDLEGELFIFQRDDVANVDRWYASYKLSGYKRIYKALGVISNEQAAKLARRELMQAEQALEEFGDAVLLGKNTIADAVKWFKDDAGQFLSEGRHRSIAAHWRVHLYKFFGGKTVIDRRLQDRMSSYVEYRRRIVNKKTGKKLHATISTIELEIVSAKQLLKMAREHAGIGNDFGNLTLKLNRQKLRKQKTRSTTFTDAEVEKIQRLFDADSQELRNKIAAGKYGNAALRLFFLERMRFFVALSLASGARVNELRQVRHRDLSNDFKSLRIRRSKTVKGSNRSAFLDNSIWDIEEAYGRFMQFSKTTKKNELVFLGKADEDSEKVLLEVGMSFSKWLKKHRMLYEKKYGKRRRNMLACRHYFITKQINDGQSPYIIATSCGTSLKQIESTYYENDSAELVKNFEEQITKKRRGGMKVVA